MRASIILTKKGVKRARNDENSKIAVYKQWIKMIFQAFWAAVYRQLNYFLS